MIEICPLEDIAEPGSKCFEHNGESYFIVRNDAQVFIYRNHCPHLGIELNWVEDQFLDAEETLIQCATHGALFLIESGECVAGPCLGESLQALSSQVVEGKIYLCE
ncbi:MAG: Rieske (2Fe-2S) protein [Spongiibacteraceae bacterium]